jgi:hypothetical protein
MRPRMVTRSFFWMRHLPARCRQHIFHSCKLVKFVSNLCVSAVKNYEDEDEDENDFNPASNSEPPAPKFPLRVTPF